MKRLWRWLFNLAAGASVVLCVATVAMWIRSYFAADVVKLVTNRQTTIYDKTYVCSELGAFILERGFKELTPSTAAEAEAVGLSYLSRPLNREPLAWRSHVLFLGFAYSINTWVDPPTGPWVRRQSYLALFVPHWFVVALLAIAPARWAFMMYRMRRRESRGLCPVCGYDLRATPDRCPECGTIPAAKV